MKGLKKVALASAIAAVSAGAQAELKALDDSAMGELTGQAGITIDVETKWSIAEFMYKDAGSLLITGIEMGGNTNANDFDGSGTAIQNSSYLDNIRMKIDVAGSGALDNKGNQDNEMDFGFSRITGLSQYVGVLNSNGDAGIGLAAASGYDQNTGLFGDRKKTYGDGDLVIHWTFTDAFNAGGGLDAYKAGNGWNGTDMTGSINDVDYATARDVATRSVDYNFKIDAIGLASSSYSAGDNVAYDAAGDLIEWESTAFTTGVDTDASDTILISQLDINGYFGPADLHIENDGNGFELTDASGNGYGDANSKIYWDSYFRITDLDVYIDIAGLYLGDVTIDNTRGDLSGLNQVVLLDGSDVSPTSLHKEEEMTF